MKLYFSKNILVKTALVVACTLPYYAASAQANKEDAKMNAFVTGLMGKMTLDESRAS